MESVLTTTSLSKQFGKLNAVSNLSLDVRKGCVYGILGPNGSGKTTTLGILLDVVPQTSGSFKWFGQEPSYQLRKRIGSILETPNFYGYLSAEKNLRISADIKEVPYSDIERVLKIVNLFDRKNDKFKYYSLGMKQRLSIAAALLGNPEVLILDEPTNGLDPQGIYEIRELIQNASAQGLTIIMASHMLDEVEKICTDVAIIKKGELLVQGRVSELLGSGYIVEVQAANMDSLHNALKELNTVTDVKKELDKFIVTFSSEISNENINKFLFEKGIILTHLASKRKNLEMQFLEITN
ncbi:MAG: ABC transporter ATP-binding protein [Bacteroidetes bacterium GWF2_43_63]|nr:MAG: ABC transporter ATP-binding protein [Bacteroidetes bacterium GWE2_42_42]OFY52632.1 MAG: ABC transporter ATP-binding protein [Bacteroidetes bacterium GWF2_43_63]HBG69906.1 ABC transporter ATP-binding protein [Bacteroidales bacterium]HCB62668.1 ABC transporter ATP-binding protein [Bacteroidales bacterium]HCY23788.1 ABC transporter ATP-binding protein [Bacteroidales bacterium]